MSEADKMFEELGYKKSEEECRVIYSKPLEGDFLYFWLYDKEVSKDRFMCGGYISMQELKAINKKCEELGWM